MCQTKRPRRSIIYIKKEHFSLSKFFGWRTNALFYTRLTGGRNLPGPHAEPAASLPEGEYSPVLCAGLRRYANERDTETWQDCMRS
jgi:hypothetical protein